MVLYHIELFLICPFIRKRSNLRAKRSKYLQIHTFIFSLEYRISLYEQNFICPLTLVGEGCKIPEYSSHHFLYCNRCYYDRLVLRALSRDVQQGQLIESSLWCAITVAVATAGYKSRSVCVNFPAQSARCITLLLDGDIESAWSALGRVFTLAAAAADCKSHRK